MTTLYIMKCNKLPYHKVGVANNVDHRRYNIEGSIQKEFGLDHRLRILHTIEIDSKHDAYSIDRYYKSNPAPMPSSWERKRDGSIFKSPFVKGKPHSTKGKKFAPKKRLH